MLHHRLHGGGLAYVGFNGYRALRPQRVQFGNEHFGVIARRADCGMIERDIRARLVQRARDLRPDALRCAGYKSGFAGEVD